MNPALVTHGIPTRSHCRLRHTCPRRTRGRSPPEITKAHLPASCSHPARRQAGKIYTEGVAKEADASGREMVGLSQETVGSRTNPQLCRFALPASAICGGGSGPGVAFLTASLISPLHRRTTVETAFPPVFSPFFSTLHAGRRSERCAATGNPLGLVRRSQGSVRWTGLGMLLQYRGRQPPEEFT